jgi:hypothetical protein
MKKNRLLISIFVSFFFILASCKSVKEGLTGQNKKKGTDEFLVQKKSPLVLPPNFEKLPVPKTNIKISKNKNLESSDILKIIVGSKIKTNESELKNVESILKKIIKDNVD